MLRTSWSDVARLLVTWRSQTSHSKRENQLQDRRRGAECLTRVGAPCPRSLRSAQFIKPQRSRVAALMARNVVGVSQPAARSQQPWVSVLVAEHLHQEVDEHARRCPA